MNIAERYQKPTPKFFRILRNIGISLATAGGAIIAAPVVLPALLMTIATYATVAGTVVTAVSQAAVIGDDDEKTNQKVVKVEDKKENPKK